MRKLVTIRSITNVQSIPNADNIQVATIENGWNVVVKKSEFNIGDQCVYFEIDSILPEADSRFSFLMRNVKELPTENNSLVKGVKLKTIRLRGQLSQGLALPLHLFPEISSTNDNLSKLLNIQKYEKPIDNREAKGDFPSFIRKTDEERIQNLINEIDFDSEERFNVTLKIDGCSATFYHYNGRYGICSRNLELKTDELQSNIWVNTNREYKILEKLKEHVDEEIATSKMLNGNMAIQGEIYGLGCNGNSEKLMETNFAIFNIFDINSQEYIQRDFVCSFASYYGLEMIPLLHREVTLRDLNITCLEDFLKLAKSTNKEGVVFRSIKRDFSFKVINNNYLLL